MERRRYPRVSTGLTARVSDASEGVSPPVSVIDISLGGALIAYADPAGLVANDRIVMCLQLPSATAVLLSKVTRVERGVDFRTYVGLEFCDGQDADLAQLSDELRREHPGCSPAVAHTSTPAASIDRRTVAPHRRNRPAWSAHAQHVV